jgi:hypothetical protein
MCSDATSLDEVESSLNTLHDDIKEIGQRKGFKRLHSNILELLPDLDYLATLQLCSNGSGDDAAATQLPEASCQRQQRLAQSLHFILSHLPSQMNVAVTYEAGEQSIGGG